MFSLCKRWIRDILAFVFLLTPLLSFNLHETLPLLLFPGTSLLDPLLVHSLRRSTAHMLGLPSLNELASIHHE